MHKIPSFAMLGDTSTILGKKEDWVKTKIVCTLGPASRDVAMLEKLYTAGMRICRLNMSHGTHEYHAESIRNIRSMLDGTKRTVGIMLDTKGPEIRTGKLVETEVELFAGQDFVLSSDETLIGDNRSVYQDYEELHSTVGVGDSILIDDGLLRLTVLSINTSSLAVTCRVENDGLLGWQKGINLPGKKVKLPAITAHDEDDIIWGIQQGIDMIAASFIRRAEDIRTIRELIAGPGRGVKIIAKIESQEGLDNFDSILQEADGIMVARGDLGVEIPIEKVFVAQKMIISKCNLAGKPVITATQMLESMIHNPRPTRAEVTDVATAVCDGTDCVMLSGETAKGKFPVECVEIMRRICREAESTLNHTQIFQQIRTSVKLLGEVSMSESICSSAVKTALDINAKLIFAMSETGATGRLVAKYRAPMPVICISPHEQVMRQCQLSRGLYPKLVDTALGSANIIRQSLDALAEKGYVQKGDLVVCVYGEREGVPGTTNVCKVITV